MEKVMDGRERRLAVGVVDGAALIGMSPSWLRREIREKRIKATHLGDRVLVRICELQRVLASGERSR
jgi:hypothetical protein